jgi:hypothetical protein
MKRLGKIVLLTLGFALLAVIWTSVPGRATLATETDRNVQLQCTTFSNDVCNTWVRVADNGTTSAFSIPSGRELRVTDIEWTSVAAPGLGALMVLIAEPGGGEVIRAVSSSVNTSFENGTSGSIHLNTPLEFSAPPLVGVAGVDNQLKIAYIQGTLGPA